MATELAPAFIWGSGGARKTPEQIAREREIAAALMQVDTSPVGHWTAGAARVLNSLGGVLKNNRADAAELANQGANSGYLPQLLGGASSAPSPVAAALAAPAAGGGVAPSPSMAGTVAPAMGQSQQEFVASLMPAAIEESARTGVDPRIIVAQAAQETGWGKSAPGNNYFGIKSHGQSGGNTLATTEMVNGQPVQTQASFRAYGSPAESVRGYGDFILQNPRYKGMREAQGLDAQLAALGQSGYATDPNYANSVGSIARGLPSPQNGVQVASTDPSAGVAQALAMGPSDVSGANALAVPAPVTGGAPQQVAQAPMQMQPPQQQAPTLNPAILRALSDPYASREVKGVAQALLQQSVEQQAQQQQQAAQQAQWMARQQYEQQMQAADPLRQLQIQKMEQDLQPQPRPLMNAGDGRIFNPNTGEWITAPGQQGFRQATPDEVKQFGTNGQVGPDGRFHPITPPQGTALSVDPTTGAVTFNQGAGVKPLTEGQSKDAFFTTRMTSALPTLEANESALLNFGESAVGNAPMGLGNYLQSEPYQLAKDAGRDFVTAYLRKDSGAALTPAEEQTYGELLLPQPGDKPARIEAKRLRRQVAVEAIKSGMPPQALDNVIKAIGNVEGANKPTPATGATPTSPGWQEIDGVKIRKKAN